MKILQLVGKSSDNVIGSGMKKFGEWIGKRDIIDIIHSNKGGFHK